MNVARSVLWCLAFACAFAPGRTGISDAASGSAAAGAPLALVPLPRSVVRGDGAFALPADVSIAARSAGARDVAALLRDRLRESGVRAHVVDAPDATVRLVAGLRDPALGDDGYRLVVDASGVSIAANGGAGLFYGAQTFAQLVPDRGARRVPYVRVFDRPAFRWRGIHLDVSRHFFAAPVVERYVDLAARYKLNVLHWHLTDDQGWRLPISRYPRLTAVGGCRAGTQTGGEDSTETDGVRSCGAYTRADVRAVVAYARRRFVTIVPEIEMPGHSVEALAAYPWLACRPGTYRTRERWGISTELLCPTERTFAFIDGVLRETAALFPGPYVHVGGDEVPKDAWAASAVVSALQRREHLADLDAVQGYFTRRVEAIARRYGKRIVGWDEVLGGGVSRSAVVMAWHGSQAAVDAARRGNDVVLTPDPPLYLDAYQGNPDFEPLAIGGLTTLEMVYRYDPLPPGMGSDAARHLLGAQANLWTEYVPDAEHLFYQLVPRELALAEACWTPRAEMDFADFALRSGRELVRLERRGVPFRVPPVTVRLGGATLAFGEQQPVPNRLDARVAGDAVTVGFDDFMPDATIVYTRDGSRPTRSSPRFDAPLRVPAADLPVTLEAVALLPNGRASAPAFVHLERAP